MALQPVHGNVAESENAPPVAKLPAVPNHCDWSIPENVPEVKETVTVFGPEEDWNV